MKRVVLLCLLGFGSTLAAQGPVADFTGATRSGTSGDDPEEGS